LPPDYVGNIVTIEGFAFKVKIVYHDDVIAIHERNYFRDEKVLDPFHYLPVFLRKPGDHPRATPVSDSLSRQDMTSIPILVPSRE
jgi:hypothetical protein